MPDAPISLDDKYTKTEGSAFMSGLHALVRLPMVQMRRDRAAGLNTGAFISGYRGSPLGGYDQALMSAKAHLQAHDVVFKPGVNEDLAATAVWGSQQVHLSPGAAKDGVVGIWYGKGPGVDRSGDVFKHGNAAGSSKHGGVLCLAGDDHGAKSSTVPHQSDHAFMSAIIPMLYPASIHEFIEMGLAGIAMSRYSGCWVGMKLISDTVETTSSVSLAGEDRQFVIPTDFELPPDGLNLRWPDDRWQQDHRLQVYKAYAAIAWARANKLDRTVIDTRTPRLGIVASGKAYEDVRQALRELEIDAETADRIGLRVYKVGMPWPLEPQGIRHFSEGLEEVLIVEERREIIENQIKQQLFNWRADIRPRIIGKFDHHDQPVLPLDRELTVGTVARAIADRISHFDIDPQLKAQIEAKLAYFDRRAEMAAAYAAPIKRVPTFCSGCPHNTSTKVTEGSRALAGIGCHFMVHWMDRSTETFTHMGGEGVTWMGTAPFTTEKHIFANLGDGTYFHSGLLAIRQSVAAGVNITYKILYNDAVAMTGGQAVDGQLTVPQITHQLKHEGVKRIYLVSDQPNLHHASTLAEGTIQRHRDALDEVMRELREVPGCTAIVYDQTCAAEKRRRRKRGLMEDPPKRVMINSAVCEGCGDCSVQSNCVSIEPLETEFGRKRQINQSSCNKDFSCVKGFCPSFVTIEGGKLRKSRAAEIDPAEIPLPAFQQATLERPYNVAITGVGGTGVLTIGAILGMAAHLDGAAAMILDMSGLAQKGGAVLSHVRLAARSEEISSPRIVTGSADLLIAADSVVAAAPDTVTLYQEARTHGVINTHLTPVADFARNRDIDFRQAQVEAAIAKAIRPDADFADFTRVAETVAGDSIATNIMMLGFAFQRGLLPISAQAIERAIELNGVSVKGNKQAFAWGRMLAWAPERVAALIGAKPAPVEMTLDALIERRAKFLTGYQNARLAERFKTLVARIRKVSNAKGLDDRLAIAVARNYAKLLAYKDEYEVARLFTAPAFKADLEAQFEGDYKVSFNLAPPLVSTIDDTSGRPKKRQFGPWMMRTFAILARMKGLRGTAFDPFGRTAERREERRLIAEYEAMVTRIIDGLTAANLPVAIELADLPDQIRGFGPVKEEAIAKARARLPELWTCFENASNQSALNAAE